jgi:hypothetical protein
MQFPQILDHRSVAWHDCGEGSVDRADNAAEGVRVMAEHCNWGGDPAVLIAESEALGPDGRDSVRWIFEHLFSRGS